MQSSEQPKAIIEVNLLFRTQIGGYFIQHTANVFTFAEIPETAKKLAETINATVLEITASVSYNNDAKPQ